MGCTWAGLRHANPCVIMHNHEVQDPLNPAGSTSNLY